MTCGGKPWPVTDWPKNEYVYRGEPPPQFAAFSADEREAFVPRKHIITLDFPARIAGRPEWDIFGQPWRVPDAPFRGYFITPFPRLSAIECRARRFASEGRSRLTAAWRSLRGDRDPFDEGCDCW